MHMRNRASSVKHNDDRHLFKIAHYKNTASNLLDYIKKEALRCNKKEPFFAVDFGHVLGNEMS